MFFLRQYLLSGYRRETLIPIGLTNVRSGAIMAPNDLQKARKSTMAKVQNDRMDKLIALCKGRGFILPDS